jgi:hypothetical protein
MVKSFFLIVLFILLVAVGPLVTLWSVNTLFPSLNIPYDFFTWLATVILGLFFRGNVSVKQ